MLDIRYIRDNLDAIKLNCANRRVNVDLDQLLVLDDERRTNLAKIEEMRAMRNKQSKGKPTEEEIAKLREVGDRIKELEIKQDATEKQYREILLSVPNLTHRDSPIGGEDDYKEIFVKKPAKDFDFEPKDHEELMIKNDLIDFERGAKVAESKFYFLKNNEVRMHLALTNYVFDIAQKHGYALVETPDVADNQILTGIGFNPRGPETQVYSIENTNLSLVGTAEITMGGYHADEVLDLSAGPKKYLAISHCYRTEAGAYGRTSKGLYRVHQFTKLEMFIFCKPEDSEKYHEEILSIEREIVEGLEIPYRVIDIASGDLGGPAYRKYDIEAWMTMKAEKGKQGGWGEITSTSNCLDYQARRLNIKYRKDDGDLEFVHTLNGTAAVFSRFPLAIIENYQQADGTIAVPAVLQKYCGLKQL